MLPDKSAKRVRRRHPKVPAIAGRARQGGFTLVEILVVLVVLVLLFALLFAPMISGLHMVTDARIRTNMQDAARLAMEQIRRDLSDAIYVYSNPTLRLAGPDGSLFTDDDEAVTDYSQIVFVKASRDGDGRLVTPIRPDRDSSGEMLAIRYLVRLVRSDQEWSSDNPFALYRQEGYYRWDDDERRYIFGKKDDAGDFVPNEAVSENVLTPTTGADLPPSTTVCRSCGASAVGYIDGCPDDCGDPDVVYLHSGIRFAPHRVQGETLAASEYNTLYTARLGAWRGYQNDGSIFMPDAALPAAESLMQPRLMLYRYNSSDDSYSDVALDSFSDVRSGVNLRWNAHDGTVRLGDYKIIEVSVAASDLSSGPTRGSGNFYQVTVSDTDVPGNSDDYSATGTNGGARLSSVEPIYGAAPSSWQDPLMPVAFAIYPDDADGADDPVDAKVVPNSAHVRISATLSDGSVRRTEYTPTEIMDAEGIGQFQFAQLQSPDDRHCEIRFNRWDPPSPEMFGELTEFTISIIYYYRRNFDPDTGRDDILVADYSSAELIDVMLALNPFRDPEPAYDGATNLVIPTDLKLHRVMMQDQVQVRNIR
jgi:prepilin-type N-terminal cleavage/methylation domain-containing protein